MTRPPKVFAAVDLGSNSFHMVVARQVDGQLVIIDRLREMVRLGEGLAEDGALAPRVAARAIACLDRFGHRLVDMRADCVRVVGTSALRRARGKQSFMVRAGEAIGYPIEVISGREEARLIYSGVAHTLPRSAGRRLVIDIGGGSTELIIGRGFEPLQLESINLGCVGMSAAHFGDGRLTARRFERARLAAQQEIEPIQLSFRRRGWESVAGSSGTVRAILDAQRELDPSCTAITRNGIERLIEVLVDAGRTDAVPLASITPERRAVIAGGVAVLAELMRQLRIRQMSVAEGAMREGVLYDLVGRLRPGDDARDRTVRSMQARYQVDVAQAARVEATAMRLLRHVKARWHLQAPLAEQSLRWAARLHEIGLDVAHSGYHRHGAYLLANADMPGFPREEQLLLARMVRSQRRKLALDGLGDLIPPWDRLAERLIVILRLAVVLHRNRSKIAPPPFVLVPQGRGAGLRFRLKSLRRHPLTEADLQQEIAHLKAAGIPLKIVFSG